MGTLGPAAESLRLAEHYRRLTDEELIVLAQRKDDLTEMAQQALAIEVSARRISVPKLEPVILGPPSVPDADDPYAEERRLVAVCVVWSERDARQLQDVLDRAGIPFYIGLEKATRVENVTSNFAGGVPVGVMRVGAPWAYEAMRRNYLPKDEPPEMEDDASDSAVHCPRCRSTDVIFERKVDGMADESGKSTERYEWTCGECGYEWEDEGVETA